MPLDKDAILEIEDASVHYPIVEGIVRRREVGRVRAVDGVTLELRPGHTLGIVGESGSGKSTLARAIMGMVPLTSGRLVISGVEPASLKGDALRQHRRTVQFVFQNPYSSLDPRMRVGSTIAEPLMIEGGRYTGAVRQRVQELLELVGLPPDSDRKFPHQFSGGQRQRIAIARALGPSPQLMVLDEPTSALDVSVRAQILNLLDDLRSAVGLTYILISHDLASVAQVVSEVAVMYRGRIMEQGPTKKLFTTPAHPYTQSLLASVPDADARWQSLVRDFEPPNAMSVPSGCRFKEGCQLRFSLDYPEVCDSIEPPLIDLSDATGNGTGPHSSACHFIAEAQRLWSSPSTYEKPRALEPIQVEDDAGIAGRHEEGAPS